MLFYIIVIEIRLEFAEIELTQYKFHFLCLPNPGPYKDYQIPKKSEKVPYRVPQTPDFGTNQKWKSTL